MINSELVEILEKYDSGFDEDEKWFIFMNDGYCPLDEDEYPIDFNDIHLTEKYKIWKYQVYMYKLLLESIEIDYQSSKNKNILDMSCGRGGGLSFYSDYYQFRNLIGVDLNPNNIKFSKSHLDKPNVKFLTSSSNHIPTKDNCLDIITSVEASSYYHVTGFNNFVNEVYRTLKPNGIYVRSDRSSIDEKYFETTKFKKINYLNINNNCRISCSISKWRLLKYSDCAFEALLNDEELYFSEEMQYNITAYQKIN
jgi:ubiquinone/menaquinone biosynthesis C-methylase UbiE